MEIIKYKKISNNKYKVIITNNIELNLYEDVILNFDLLLKKEISYSDLEKIKKENNYYDFYYRAIKFLKKIRSVNEVKKHLLKYECDNEIIDKIIDKLKEQGYLNDFNFIKTYVNNQIINTNKGPKRIIFDISKYNVCIDEVNMVIEELDSDIFLNRIRKEINILLKRNNNKSGLVLKKKIINHLIYLGYNIDSINLVIEEFDFKLNNDLIKKEYDKLYNKLSKKYDGYILKQKIKEKMYQKGLVYEED